jgi:hypothetical protein
LIPQSRGQDNQRRKTRKKQGIPFGYLLHSHGKIHHF